MSPRTIQLGRSGPQAAARRAKGHRRPPVVIAAPAPVPALGERIAKSLVRRPMSAPTLAALLGVNEMAVSIQLAAMAEAGQVVAGPAAEVGIRHREWKRAA